MKVIHKYWWNKPDYLVLCFILPFYVLIYFKSNKSGLTNYFTFEPFLLGIVFLIIFIFSANVGRKVVQKKRKQYFIKESYLDFVALAAILGYIVWFYWIAIHPSIFIGILLRSKGIIYSVRSDYGTIPGITTLAQLGPLYIILYMIDKDRIILRERHKIYLKLIIVLTVLRTLAWSERLAIIEIVVPLFLYITNYGDYKSKKLGKVLEYLPFIGIFALLIFFGISEYFRSWVIYSREYDSYISFIIDRFSLYYYAALNNVSAVIVLRDWPSYSFSSYLNWIYNFPLLGHYISILKPSDIAGNWIDFLTKYLNPEFNNSSGILSPYVNSGILGGFLYALLWGGGAGFFYKQYLKRSGLGYIIFPIFFISILDMLREPYLSQTRVFPIFLFAIIGYLFFKRPVKVNVFLVKQ